MNSTSNSGATLAELAKQARGFHVTTIENYLALGFVLTEARAIAPHGDWLPFLKDAGISPDTAQRAMRLARAGVKCRTVRYLGGIRATLQALTNLDAAIEHSLAYWREWMRVVPEDSPHRPGLVQSRPDGPIGTRSWLEFGDAIAAARTDDERRAAFELRPWKRREVPM